MTEPQTQPQNTIHHDDCEDCRRQRHENEQFIAVYERMQTLRKHVEKTAYEVKNHSQLMNQVRTLSKSLDNNLIKTAILKGEVDCRTIETFGYELAASFAEKKAKNKLKEQNEFLRRRIQAMRQNQVLKDNAFTLPKINQRNSRARRESENKIPIYMQSEVNTNGWPTVQDNSECASTRYSFFKQTKQGKSTYRQKYRNLNLWLYQKKNSVKDSLQL